MTWLGLRKVLSATRQLAQKGSPRKKREREARRWRTAAAPRRLGLDPLEQRQLLSLAPADWDQILVNERFAVTQEMVPGRSVAVDADGDFVIVWTRIDPVLDSVGNPVVDPRTGQIMQDANIYARYFTDEVQRIFLPSEVLVDNALGLARVDLVVNGREVQKLVLSSGYQPYTPRPLQELISGTIILGYDVNRNGIIEEPFETTSFLYNEAISPVTNAQNLQMQLRVLGGDLADVVVKPINAREFLIEFGEASVGPGNIPRNVPSIQVLYSFTDLNPLLPGLQPPGTVTTFATGFYPFAEVITVREPVLLSNIPISPTDPALTAQIMEQSFWVTSQSFSYGPIELGMPPVPREGPTSLIPSMRTPVPEVKVTPVLGVPGYPDGTVFDITFTGTSGKKDHPTILVSRVADETGSVVNAAGVPLASLAQVRTLKEPSPEFRVNPEEPDDPFTLLPDKFAQTNAVVAMDSDGDFVIVWQSEVPTWVHPTSVTDIFARRFRPVGWRNPTEIDFLVDMNLDGIPEFPVQGVIPLVSPEAQVVQRITINPSVSGPIRGNFRLRLVGQTTRDIIFDSTNLSSSANSIRTALTAAGFQDVSVRVLSSSAPFQFEVTFKATFSGPNGRRDLEFQFLEPTSGPALMGLATLSAYLDPNLDVYTFRVNQDVNGAQAQPAVAMDGVGNFVVVWGSGAQDISFFNTIRARRYDRFGTPLGNEWVVNTEDTNEHFEPVVGMSPDGWFVVSWTMTPNRVATSVWAEVYDNTGAVRQSQFALGGGSGPNVGFGVGNEFVITYNVPEADLAGAGSGPGIRAIQYRLFDAQGNFSLQTVRSTFRANSADFDPASARFWPFDQYGGQPMLDADGDLVIVFDGFGPDVSEAEIDRLIESQLTAALSGGATPAEVARLRAQLEAAYGWLRGEGSGALYTRFDADPLLGTMNILARDAIINALRDGHNTRVFLAFDQSVDQGSFELEVTINNVTQATSGIQYQRTNLAASRTNIENALRGLAITGTAWPSPFGQSVSVRLVPAFEVLQRAGTPWELTGVPTSDVVFEIVFQGSVHDTPIFVSYRNWQGQTPATNELQLLSFFVTGPGWFSLTDGLRTTANLYFDPSNPQAVAAAIQGQLRALVTGVDAQGNPIRAYSGVVVTYRSGTTDPFQFELNFVGASAGVNHPQITQGLLQGPPFPDPPLPGYIVGTTITQGGTQTAPPPRLRLFQIGDPGTIQERTSGGMEPDGDFTAVFIQRERLTNAVISNSNIYYRRFDESTDTAGPRVTDLVDAAGYSIARGRVTEGPVYHLVVTFDEELFAQNPDQFRDSVLNPENFVLYRGDVEIPGGVVKVEFGLNKAAELAGRPDGVDHDGDGIPDGIYRLNPLPTNKWEAVLTLDANGVIGPGAPPLEAGDYRIVVRAPNPAQNISGIRDLAGNPLSASGYAPAGSDISLSFSVTSVIPDLRVDALVGTETGRTFAEAASAVARDGDGDYVVVWTVFDPVAGVDRLYFRLFDADGSPADLPYLDSAGNPVRDAAGNILVARDTFPAMPVTPPTFFPEFLRDHQRFGTVAIDADGDFVITWTNIRGNDADIYARRLDSLGGVRGINITTGALVFNTQLPPPFRVNELTAGEQTWPHVAMNAQGDFVITWTSFVGSGTSGDYDVFARRYDLFGQALGPEFRVNVTTGGNQQFSKVAMDAQGGFVVVWQSDQGGVGTDIFARSFWPDGSPQVLVDGTAYVYGEILVNQVTAGNQIYPHVAMNMGGDRVAFVWAGPDGNQNGVFARVFGRNIDPSAIGSLTPLVDQFQVNVTVNGEQTYPSIAMGATGNFVVAWSGRGEQAGQVDVSGHGVFTRAYDRDGNPVFGETRINNTVAGNQWMPSVASDYNGNYVVVWTGEVNGATQVYHGRSLRDFADVVGPIVAGVYTVTGERVLSGGVVPGPVSALVFAVSENLSTRLADSDGDGVLDVPAPDSVLNVDNWLLLRDGTQIPGGIHSVSFARNPLTRKYEVTVILDANGTAPGVAPLQEGNYSVLMQDTINDWYFVPIVTMPFFSGRRLDGDFDGVPGTSVAVGTGASGYLFNFGVTTALAQFGGEFRINESTQYIQRFVPQYGTGLGYEKSTQAVAVDADGDYVVVWVSYGQDNPAEPLGAGVYMRIFDRNHNPLTPEILVNQTTQGDQRNPAVAIDADGDIVVVWESRGDNPDGSLGIWARRFDSMGRPLGGEFLVNTNTQHDQYNPAVAMDAFGNFVVVWVSTGQPTSYFNDIRGQLFNYRGERVGGEFRVNVANIPGPAGVELNPTVARSANGNFVVIWETVAAMVNGVVTDTVQTGRLFDPTGTPLTGEFRVDTGVGTGGTETHRTARNAKAVMDEIGGFIVVWEAYSGNPVTHYDVFWRRFDASGNPVATGQANMPQFDRAQVNPAVAVDADGDFVVVWNGNGAQPNRLFPADPNLWVDQDDAGIFMRKYNAANTPIDVQVRVNRTQAGDQRMPSVGMTREGDILVVWSGAGVGDQHGIFARWFDEPRDTAGPIVTDVLSGRGTRLLGGAQVTEAVTEIIVIFSEDMMRVGPSAVTNPANYMLLKDGTPIFGAITSISFGLNPATNKWQATLQIDGNGALPGVVPLDSGQYELVILNTLRDLVGNPLYGTGLNPNGQQFRTSFTVAVLPGQDLLVNTQTTGIQQLASGSLMPGSPRSVAGDGDGEYVVVWRDTNPGSQGIWARIYNDLRWLNTPSGRVATGPNPSAPILVTANPTAQFASVARDADGDFVVVWEQDDDPGPGEDWNIWARRFDAMGRPYGEAFRVNSETAGPQRYPAVAMDVDGDFVIVWQSLDTDGTGWNIYGKRFGPAGYPLGGTNEVQLITFVNNPRGTFSLRWDGDDNPATPNTTGPITFTGNAFEIARIVEDRLNALARNAAGVQVNQVQVRAVGVSQLLVEFVGPGAGKNQTQIEVDWANTTLTGGPGATIFIQTLVEGEISDFLVNATLAGDQLFPSVAMGPGGEFVVTWTSTGQDGDAPNETNVYMRKFPSNEAFGPYRGDPVYGAINPRAPYLSNSRTVVSTDNIALHQIIPGTGYDGVVAVVALDAAGNPVSLGTGALLWTGYHILTAAHVVTDALGNVFPTVQIEFVLPPPIGPVTISSSQIIVHPAYDPADLFVNDIAVIVLPQPAPPGAPRYQIYRQTDEMGKITTFAGYGLIGQGATGAVGPGYPNKYFGSNRYEATGERFNGLRWVDLGYNIPGGPRWAPGMLLAFDFDSGQELHDAFYRLFGLRDLGLGAAEAMVAPGDSGGPQFISGLIAGVTAGILRPAISDFDAALNSSFGEIGLATRVSFYASWIDEVIGRGLAGTPEVLVNQTIAGNQKWSTVAIDANGDVVVTWTSYGQDGGGGSYGPGFAGENGVFARRFLNDLTPASNEFQVNQSTVGNQQRSQIAMDLDGDFVIVWESHPDAGSGLAPPTEDFGIYARRYVGTRKLATSPLAGPNGELTGEIAINATKLGDQRSPAVAMSHNGDAVIVWEGAGALPTADRADPYGIYHTRLWQTHDTAPPIVADVLGVYRQSGQRVVQQILPDSLIRQDVTQLAVSFSENLLADRTTNFRSVTNPSNWTLYRNGQMLPGAVVSVSFGLNQMSAAGLVSQPTNKYEAVLVVDGDPSQPGLQPLGPGIYELVISDRIEDLFGNRLDGDLNGIAGGQFVRGFIIGDPEQVFLPVPGTVPGPGEDPLVHRLPTGRQDSPAIASNANGDFVIVWVEWTPAVDPVTGAQVEWGDIYAQRFNSRGEKVGTQIAVNTYATGNQYQPAVAMDDFGNFVVVWAGEGWAAGEINVVERHGIYARVFDALGQPITDQFQVNQYRPNVQDRPRVAMDADGDFVVTWTSYGQDSDKDGVFARMYTLQGVPKGPEFLVNTVVQNRQDNPDVAMDANGNFVIVWRAFNHPNDGNQWGIFGQRFNAAGQKVGGEFRINTYTAGDQVDPRVAMDAAGNFVVVWSSFNQDGSGYGVYAQRFNAAGQRIGSEFRVNQRTIHWQYQPDVAMDDMGNFIITWTSIGQDLPDIIDAGVFARIYRADGSDFIDPTDPTGTRPLGEFNVNLLRLGDQNFPAVTISNNGRIAFAWVGPDADQTGVYYRLMTTGTSVSTTEAPLSGFTVGNVYQALGSPAAGQALVLAGTSGNDTFEFTGGPTPDRWVVKINGNRITIPPGTTSIVFDGLGGNDTVVFKGTAGDETLYRWPDRAIFEGATFGVTVSNVETVTAYGQGGADVAYLYDSPGADKLTVTASYVVLSGTGFYSRVMDFPTIVAYSSGGTDSARFFASAANEEFVGSPTSAVLQGSGYQRRAEGFSTVSAYAGSANDVAKLYDRTDSEDVLVATPAYTKISGAGYSIQAVDFKKVYGYSSDTKDVAKLYDGTSNDTFVGKPAESLFWGRDFWYQVVGFRTVAAYSRSGVDTAQLYDSVGDDVAVLAPTYVTLSGTNFQIQAHRFRNATVFSSAGNDLARFYDSASLNETLVVGPGLATMSANGGNYTNRAEGFRRFEATSTGGADTVRIYDSPGNDTLTATSTYSVLTGPNYSVKAYGFRYNYVYSVAGGTDTGKLYGSAGDDNLVGYPTYLRLSNNTYWVQVEGFRSLRVFGQAGRDRAWLYDSALSAYPDRLQVGSNWVRMYNPALGYDYRLEDFERVEATSSNPEDVKEFAGAVDFLITRGYW